MIAFPWHREALARLLSSRERMPHALLVQGRSGIGKTEFARALAAAVLCEAPRPEGACGEFPSCRWFAQGNHPDFREVVPEAAMEDEEGGEGEEPAKAERKSLVIKIEQVRALAEFVTLSTHRGGYRVLVIRPAEALHPAAANALLKTLEEPPPATLIVLVSAQPARLLPTIRSRCRSVLLPVPDRETALAWLRSQAAVEDAGTALAVAGGAPLLARELADAAEVELRRRVLAELARPAGVDVLRLAPSIDRQAVERFLYWMQTWVQDLLRVRLAGEPRHHRDNARALSARAGAADVVALFDLDRELAAARGLASHPLNPRLLAEHLLLAYNRATSAPTP